MAAPRNRVAGTYLSFQCAFLAVPGRGLPLVDDGGWNTVPISKGSRPIDTSQLTKITKVGVYMLEGMMVRDGRIKEWSDGP